MRRYLADEGFRREIVRAWRAQGGIGECITVQEAGLTAESDDALLSFAANEGLVVWTHDVRTMVPAAWERVRQGQAMPGLVAVPWDLAVGDAVRDLLLLQALDENEFRDRVLFLPLA